MTDLDRVRAVLDAASDVPWEVGTAPATGDAIYAAAPTGWDHEDGETYLVAWCHADDRAVQDARAIVLSRNLLPAALDVVERMEWALRTLQGTTGYSHPPECSPMTCICGYQDAVDALDAFHAKMKETL